MRSEAWRPAAAACNRLPREAREVARQALRPGCEELAARSRRQLPAVVGRRAPKETEARPRGPKPPRWSAERGERPASWQICMGLHNSPQASRNALGVRNLMLWRSIALHGAPLVYFGHLSDTGSHSLPKPRSSFRSSTGWNEP